MSMTKGQEKMLSAAKEVMSNKDRSLLPYVKLRNAIKEVENEKASAIAQ